MALFTIKEGAHYHAPFPISTLPWLGERSMSRTVTFDASCQYELPAYNAEDVNKLFGLSFGFGGVHHNSARFGWRWSKEVACIDLVAYCYVAGRRNQDEQLRFPVVARVKPGKAVRCEIAAVWEYVAGKHLPVYTFLVEGPGISNLAVVPRNEVPAYGLTHGVYFGGALPATHEMRVRIDRN